MAQTLQTLRAIHLDWHTHAEADATVLGLLDPCPALRGCATLADVLAAVRREPDGVLAFLIGLAQDRRWSSSSPGPGNLPGRVVVQAMVPKLVRMASLDPDNDVLVYLGCLWETIVGYPLARRPRRVASNLALDTLKLVKRRVPPGRAEVPLGIGDEMSWQERPGEDVADDTDGVRVLLAAGSLGLLDDLSRQTLEAVYLHGLSSRQAAERLGTSADVVRWRCSRALRRLRRHAVALADAVAA